MSYLCHYGVKGMKWGIRRNRFVSKSKKRSMKNRNLGDLNKSVARGAKKTAQFLKDNKNLLLTSAAVVGLTAIGVPYASLAINAIGNLNMSSMIQSHVTVSGTYSSSTKTPSYDSSGNVIGYETRRNPDRTHSYEFWR